MLKKRNWLDWWLMSAVIVSAFTSVVAIVLTYIIGFRLDIAKPSEHIVIKIAFLVAILYCVGPIFFVLYKKLRKKG